MHVPPGSYLLYKDGSKWCAVRPLTFKNLQESLAGFGDTPNQAIFNLDSLEENPKNPVQEAAEKGFNEGMKPKSVGLPSSERGPGI